MRRNSIRYVWQVVKKCLITIIGLILEVSTAYFLKLLDLKTSHFKIQIHKGQFFKDTFPINTFPYVWLVKLLRAVKKIIHDFSSALCRRRFKQRSKGTCAKVAELTTFFRWKLTTYPKDGAQRACASQNVQSCACADHSGTSSYKLPVNRFVWIDELHYLKPIWK